jgi:hypothetical protein
MKASVRLMLKTRAKTYEEIEENKIRTKEQKTKIN